MPDAIQHGLIRRLRYTPMRDWIRGRITARLDWESTIAESTLPFDIQALIIQVVRMSRLWRLEKTEVARELMAHFTDGLERGRTPENLIEEFGESRQSARLIRRAQIRNRPLIWQLIRWVQRAFIVVVLAYCVLAGMFFFSHPQVKVDYVAQLNQPILKASPSDLAWPLYRQAILQMFFKPSTAAGTPREEVDVDCLSYSIDGRRWPEIETFTRSKSAALTQLLEASKKPIFGFKLGRGGSVEDKELFNINYSKSAVVNEPNSIEPAINVLLPYLNYVRSLAAVVMADCKLAQIDRDPQRLTSNILATLRLADHLHESGAFLVTDLVAIGIRNLAHDMLCRALTQPEVILTNEQLIELAHAIARPKLASDLVSIQSERIWIYDMVQRIYSDDGQGDGHLTFDGMQTYKKFTADIGMEKYTFKDPFPLRIELLKTAAAPFRLALGTSRKEFLQMYDGLMDLYESNLHKPFRDVDLEQMDRVARSIASGWLNRTRYAEIVPFVSSLNRIGWTAEVSLGFRDGVPIGIAMELYRREHRAYPKELYELSPKYLPTVPVDRVTGGPLRYRLISGKPLIYSVGENRLDDDGQIPRGSSDGTPEGFTTREAVKAKPGDWILYPRPVPADE